MRFCPTAGCTKTCKSLDGKVVDVSCECGIDYCFGCGNDTHSPIDCDLLEVWYERIFKEDESKKEVSENPTAPRDLNKLWLEMNTKKCPKCKIIIEKNSGCMHMTCGKCSHEFCWLCLGSAKSHSKHGYFEPCNSFAEA